MTEEKKEYMKVFVEKGCDCGAKKGYWAVEGPPFCKWSCNICYKETTVYWDP